MLFALTTLLAFQLAGEAVATLSGGMLPGPVIGFAALAAALAALPRLRRAVEPTAAGLLRHLSLLFVPAAVGVVQQLPRLRAEGVAIGAALLVSTVAAMAVGALCFRAVAARIEGPR
jgi:putative effector of murein hydrolase LrgA (UPF0299 family)